MSWIKTLEYSESTAPLRELYGALTEGGRRLDNILKIHTLHPAGMQAHLTLYRTVMTATPGLPKVDRELIALVVSHVNQCHY